MTWVARLLPRLAAGRQQRCDRAGARPSPPYPDAVAVTSPADLQSRLVDLRDSAVERVNCAVAEGRLDLVRALVDEYTDDALAAITAEGGRA